MLDTVAEQVKQRDEARARGEDVDTRPAWRVLRAAVWVQFGALLDLEKLYDRPRDELLASCVGDVCASMIQQRERLYDLAHERMAAVVEQVLSAETAEDDWDWDALEEALSEQFNIPFELDPGTPDEAAAQAWPRIEEKLKEREKELSVEGRDGRAWLAYFVRTFFLEEIDQQWIEHLKTMDALREGIGLQGYGQKDPKKEYKKAGFSLFTEMMQRIQANCTQKIFRVHFERKQEQIPEVEQKQRQMIERGVADKSEDGDEDVAEDKKRAPRRATGKARTSGDGAKTEPIKRDRPKVGRNDPCPCGSGKKYKKCHGKDEEAAASE
jgi:preprotein translocase subunit SecA